MTSTPRGDGRRGPRPPKNTEAFDRMWKGPAAPSIFTTNRPDDDDKAEPAEDAGTEPDPLRRLARSLFGKPTDNNQ